MSVIAAILAIIKVIPVLDKWAQLLIAAYTASQLESMRKENREAIRKALDEYDQRELERVVGHPNPGMPSGDEGTERRDRPPGGLDDGSGGHHLP